MRCHFDWCLFAKSTLSYIGWVVHFLCRPVTISTLRSDKIYIFWYLFAWFRKSPIYRLISNGLYMPLIRNLVFRENSYQNEISSSARIQQMRVHMHTWILLSHPPPHFSKAKKKSNIQSNWCGNVSSAIFYHCSTVCMPVWIEFDAVAIACLVIVFFSLFFLTCLHPKHSAPIAHFI